MMPPGDTHSERQPIVWTANASPNLHSAMPDKALEVIVIRFMSGLVSMPVCSNLTISNFTGPHSDVTIML